LLSRASGVGPLSFAKPTAMLTSAIGRQPIRFSIVNQILVLFFFGQPFAKRQGIELA
jgi:hypothetical protein